MARRGDKKVNTASKSANLVQGIGDVGDSSLCSKSTCDRATAAGGHCLSNTLRRRDVSSRHRPKRDLISVGVALTWRMNARLIRCSSPKP